MQLEGKKTVTRAGDMTQWVRVSACFKIMRTGWSSYPSTDTAASFLQMLDQPRRPPFALEELEVSE